MNWLEEEFNSEVKGASLAIEHAECILPRTIFAIVCVGIHNIVVAKHIIDIRWNHTAETFCNIKAVACIEVKLVAERNCPGIIDFESLTRAKAYATAAIEWEITVV